MRPTGGGTSGPFDYYPVAGERIHEVANAVNHRADALDDVRRLVTGQDRRLLSAVAGELRDPVRAPTSRVNADAEQLSAAARFASAVLRLFGDAIADYNRLSTDPRSVEALNTAYLQARLNDFGLDPADYQNGGAAAGRDYAEDASIARAALVGPRGSLTAEYRRLGLALDLWAEHAAGMLERGPNPADVAELWAFGAFPSEAARFWPGLDLANTPTMRLPVDLRSGSDDRRGLQDLNHDELWELWKEHGFEPARAMVAQELIQDSQDALRDFGHRVNPNYWNALAEGLPEGLAQRVADANPATFFDFLGPLAKAGETGYKLTIGDLAESLREDPLSWGALGELAMMAPIGRVGKLRNLDEILDNADDVRDVKRVLNRIDEKGSPLPDYKGGSKWHNSGKSGAQKLPTAQVDGTPIEYREWDLHLPKPKRGAQRIVTGSDGSAWFTYDHYKSFIQIRDGVE